MAAVVGIRINTELETNLAGQASRGCVDNWIGCTDKWLLQKTKDNSDDIEANKRAIEALASGEVDVSTFEAAADRVVELDSHLGEVWTLLDNLET